VSRPGKLVPAELAPDVIVRERVLRRLSVEDRFTLVSAMPGYGTTAAVRQWIDTVDVPVAWLSLDLLDQDVVWFWSNFLAALGTAVPGIDDEPAMLLWERGGDDRLFLGALVAELNELATPVVLVIDGVSSDIDRTALEGVALLVERAGGTLRVVVTTRSDPPLPLARWRSVGWLNELREDLLRLTDGEALEIADRTDTAIRDPDEANRSVELFAQEVLPRAARPRGAGRVGVGGAAGRASGCRRPGVGHPGGAVVRVQGRPAGTSLSPAGVRRVGPFRRSVGGGGGRWVGPCRWCRRRSGSRPSPCSS
jgi:hypothetical protein